MQNVMQALYLTRNARGLPASARRYMNAPDVIAKKKRGIQYCEVASRWGKANGYKQWRYLFIPSKQVMPNSSFMQLAKRFGEY